MKVGLVEDVRELMMHCLEEIMIHVVHIRRIKIVYVVKVNLDTVAGITERLSTLRGVIVLGTTNVNDAGTIGLEELLSGKSLVDIIPKVLGEYSEVDTLVVVGRSKVLVHIRPLVLETVDELEVVGFEELLLAEGVEGEGI